MMATKKIYFPNLDGLRFIAFFTVFVAHSLDFSGFKFKSDLSKTFVSRFLLNGDLGVNFFFVLSGFLITFSLLQEKHEKATVAVVKFYMRRILRI